MDKEYNKRLEKIEEILKNLSVEDQEKIIQKIQEYKENTVQVEKNNPEEFKMIVYKPKFYVKAWKFVRRIFRKEEYYI